MAIQALVIFDSVHGNTEKIARAIGDGLSKDSVEVDVLSTKEVNLNRLGNNDLLVVGAPTHAGRPSSNMKEFLTDIPEGTIKNKKVSAFDTRIEGREKGIGIRILTGVLGYAAGRIVKSLKKKGGELVVEPEGFIVDGREGPLKQGELDRARNWAKEIVQSIA